MKWRRETLDHVVSSSHNTVISTHHTYICGSMDIALLFLKSAKMNKGEVSVVCKIQLIIKIVSDCWVFACVIISISPLLLLFTITDDTDISWLHHSLRQENYLRFVKNYGQRERGIQLSLLVFKTLLLQTRVYQKGIVMVQNLPQVCNLKSFWHIFEVTSKVNFGLWPL